MATGIYKKLNQIQVKLKASKSQYNSFGKYYYRNLEDIQEALKPLLEEQGVIVTLTDDIKLIGDRYYIEATAKVIDIEDGSSVEVKGQAREVLDKKGMDQSQITGSASSYARKYAMNGLFAIDDTKDADNQDNSKQGQPSATPKQSKGSGNGTISEAQLNRLYAIAKSKGVDSKTVDNQVQTKFNKHPSKLHFTEYNTVVAGYESVGAK